jgi:hypothetical protein
MKDWAESATIEIMVHHIWFCFFLQTLCRHISVHLKTSENGCLCNFYADQTTDSVSLFNEFKCNELGWLPFHYDVHISRCGSYAAAAGIKKACLEIILVRNSDRHQRNTRFASFKPIRCPRYCKAAKGGRSFSMETTKDRNVLPHQELRLG